MITEFVITKFHCNSTARIIGKTLSLQMTENMNQGELNRVYRTILFIKHLHLFSFNALVLSTYVIKGLCMIKSELVCVSSNTIILTIF